MTAELIPSRPDVLLPSEIRRTVYTTNTIKSLNASLRKVGKNRSLFPNDEVVFKLIYLALRNMVVAQSRERARDLL
ncbi:MAG: transposase [Pyrinomonadaceae bacterium]